MKNYKKFFVVSFFVIIVLTITALSVFASSAFSDVKQGAWYYDAVNETVEAGVFTGTSKNEFSPNLSMTRAMFVTTLARMNNVDVSEYTGVSFTDVQAGSWYAPYVEWAYKNEITNGIGNGKFGVENTITRQEMVALFYKSAAKFGENVEIPDEFKYNRSYDKDSCADWATEGMKWALANFVISGTGNEGDMLVLSPEKTATRAEAAQLIVNYFDFQKADTPYIGKLTINGNPIDKYKIVYGEGIKDAKNAAKSLVDYIERSTGVTLTYVTDAEPVSDYEIIIGTTNREGTLVKVDRDGTDRGAFEISVQGNYLVIAAKYDEYEGNSYGVIGLALEKLGFGFYSGNVSTIKRQEAVDLPDGYVFKDQPGFEYRVVYWSGKPEEERTGEPFRRKGYSHNLPDITGVPLTQSEPCLTDPDIINHSIETVKGYLKEDPELEIIYVIMNDRPDFCACERCMEVYRTEGSRGATIMLLCDTIAKEIKKDYPNCYILTAAYLHTINPIKSKLDDNVMVYYCPIENCASHDYNDPTCPLNASMLTNMQGWSNICNKMWVWDYSANFTYSFAAFPILESLRDNKEWFYELGVVGEFNNAIQGRSGEFGNLVAYLLGKLQWDPTMSEEEYQAEIDAFLEAYYGAGWKNVRAYIDTMELLSEKNHFGYHVVPDGVIDYEDILANMDTFEGYWDAAEAMAKDADELNRVQRSRISWTYTMLTALYTRDYCGDDAAAKDAYIDLANSFHEEVNEL
ncbi:MAG: DUF4838 domain-containing protein, partial [Clostridia bacterium]|nr:DUF4838 domain-containing protein [Clostridia bacterium]